MVALYEVDVSGAVSKEEYVSKYLQIVKLLMPRMSAEEACAEAEVKQKQTEVRRLTRMFSSGGLA